MLGDFALVALLADFLSLYLRGGRQSSKEGGLEANVSLNGAESRDGLGAA